MPAGVKRAKIMENSIINSLKRLERAGEENSKTNEKLKIATKEVADFIVAQFNIDPISDFEEGFIYYFDLCDGYYISFYGNSTHFKKYLQKGSYFLNSCDDDIRYWSCYYYRPVEPIHKGGCLKFADDLSNGLLDKIADIIEKENIICKSASDIFEKEIEKPKEN